MAEQSRTEMRPERQRKRLLALMASHIASGMAACSGHGTDERNDRIADSSVDVAERILRRVGL